MRLPWRPPTVAVWKLAAYLTAAAVLGAAAVLAGVKVGTDRQQARQADPVELPGGASASVSEACARRHLALDRFEAVTRAGINKPGVEIAADSEGWRPHGDGCVIALRMAVWSAADPAAREDFSQPLAVCRGPGGGWRTFTRPSTPADDLMAACQGEGVPI